MNATAAPATFDESYEELRRKSAQFKVLQRVSANINSTLELRAILDIALETMDELFRFHHAVILLLSEDARTLTVTASRGYEGQALGGVVTLGTGVIGMVAEKRRPPPPGQPRRAARLRGRAAPDDGRERSR